MSCEMEIDADVFVIKTFLKEKKKGRKKEKKKANKKERKEKKNIRSLQLKKHFCFVEEPQKGWSSLLKQKKWKNE